VPLEEGQPRIGFGEVQLAIAVCIAGSPLSGKHGYSSRLGGVNPGPQLSAMSVCIEVNSIRKIHARDGVAGCNVHFLRPGPGSKNDDILGVRADYWDDLFMIVLDCRPRNLQRLVVGFIHDIRTVAVPRGHLIEEASGLVNMILSGVIVPIDDHIDTGGDCSIDACDDFVFLIRVLDVATLVVCTHGKPHDCAFPIFGQPADDIGIPIFAHPLGPEHRHSSQEHRGAMRANDIVAAHSECSVLFDRRSCRGRWCGSWRRTGRWEWRRRRPTAARRWATWIEAASAFRTICR